jgi:hypothetical protein
MAFVEPPIPEEFTTFDTEGEPVQRPVAEMTADEVLECLEWHADETDGALEISEMLHGDDDEALVTAELLKAQVDALERVVQAAFCQTCLINQVIAVMEPNFDPGTAWGMLVHRHWPDRLIAQARIRRYRQRISEEGQKVVPFRRGVR